MQHPPFYDFVTAINEHDTDRLLALMTEDHVLLDPNGREITGLDNLRQAWTGYFKWFPDYVIELAEAWEMGPSVLATGSASASYKGAAELQWKIPAAWRATLREEKVSRWQVFADTKAPFDSMRKGAKSADAADEAPKRVTGIGGIFFKSQNPERLRAWYEQHLGFHVDAYGTSFAWKQPREDRKGFTVWSPFPEDTTYFSPSLKPFMFNYRVENIHSLIAQLKEEGVTILDDIQTYPYGKFVHIADPENNKIELWEADDEEYERLAQGVTG